jgi:hypothetical protein
VRDAGLCRRLPVQVRRIPGIRGKLESIGTHFDIHVSTTARQRPGALMSGREPRVI